jgi:hypothetical protein
MTLLAQVVAYSLVDGSEPDVAADRRRNVSPGSDNSWSRAGHGPVLPVGTTILGASTREATGELR